MRLNAESDKAVMQGLESEKSHLQVTLKENISLKEQYRNKCDSLQNRFENLFKESSINKSKIVEIDEIKKDRDMRIKELREEIEQISG
jgi:uncharacterized protein (DUF2344 family)